MPELNLGKVVGPQGPQGATGPTGPEGKQGPQGQTGEAGKSAYQAARDGGYTGTEADFNAILAMIERHAGRHKTGGADPLTAADIGAALNYAGNIKTDHLLDWAKTQNSSVCGFASSANVPAGLPVDKAGYAFVSTSGSGGWSLLYYCPSEKSIYFNMTNAGVWIGWEKIATTGYAVSKAGDTMTGALRFDVSGGLARIGADPTAGYAYIQHYKEDGTAANITVNTERVRFSTKSDPNGSWVHKDVLHTGNKPSGSYPGTGAAWAEALNTGGTGNVALIRNNGITTIAIVSYNGAVVFNTSSKTTTYHNTSEVVFRNGILTMNTGAAGLNGNETYFYQVL